MLIGLLVTIPALSPLLSGKRFPPKVGWRESVAVAVFKAGLCAVFIALLFTPFPSVVSQTIGALIAVATAIGGISGAVILVFVGFWDPEYGGVNRARDEVMGRPIRPPPDAWHVIKWSVIGAGLLLLSISLFEHPFEMAKVFVHHND